MQNTTNSQVPCFTDTVSHCNAQRGTIGNSSLNCCTVRTLRHRRHLNDTAAISRLHLKEILNVVFKTYTVFYHTFHSTVIAYPESYHHNTKITSLNMKTANAKMPTKIKTSLSLDNYASFKSSDKFLFTFCRPPRRPTFLPAPPTDLFPPPWPLLAARALSGRDA